MPTKLLDWRCLALISIYCTFSYMNLEEIKNIIKLKPWIILPETTSTLWVCHLWTIKPVLWGRKEGGERFRECHRDATEVLVFAHLVTGFQRMKKYGHSLYGFLEMAAKIKLYLSLENCVATLSWPLAVTLIFKDKKRKPSVPFLALYFWQFVLSHLCAEVPKRDCWLFQTLCLLSWTVWFSLNELFILVFKCVLFL